MMPAATISRKHAKREHLEARITSEQKRLIERAARLRGTSVADFVVHSVRQAATETIRDFEVLTLGQEDSEVFVNAILHPPAPNAALKSAAARYKAEILERR
jgi:uncharacterized protein (DUF1778 family)